MKKLLFILLTLVCCAAFLAPVHAAAQSEKTVSAMATNNTIVVSSSADQPDAHVVRPAVYKIDGANYFKLRDIAMLLNGSVKQFAVDYDDTAKSVSITSGKPYEAIGSELSGNAAENAAAIVSNNAILIDGAPVTVTVYKIEGANYFKLRDLGRALDFHVGYDDETKTVFISGGKGYEEEEAPGWTGRIPFRAQYVRTNGYRDGAKYPVVTLIETADELKRYYEDNGELYDFSHKELIYADSSVGFVDAIALYDDAWFAEHQLLIVLLEEGSGSVRHEVTTVTAGPDPSVDIMVLTPEVGTDDMAEWHILIETPPNAFETADGIAVRFTVKNAE